MNGEALSATIAPLTYLFSSSLLIFGLKRLARVRTARSGNAIAAAAMALAVAGTLVELGVFDYRWVIGGIIVGSIVGAFTALRVEMTAMPEMVALFNGFGGLASSLVALSLFWTRAVETSARGTGAEILGDTEAVTSALSILIGGVTFTGSVVAFMKLRGQLAGGRPLLFRGRHVVNALLVLASVVGTVTFTTYVSGAESLTVVALALTAISFVLGVLLVIPIGGADMPVVVSLLNSYSGVAASAAGFVIGNPALIIAGAMVGAAGLILTNLMCKAMNRSLVSVLVGGFGQEAGEVGSGEYAGVKSAGAAEAAMVLDAARSVVIVPGYGLAVAQAQHAVRELAHELEKRGASVGYAIHPVAGRMPGHMNVLLAEADVPYDRLFELETINPELRTTDVAIVIGANDVVNPAAMDDPKSPIYGMPILHVHHAKTVFVVKRSLGAGYAGIKNTLFERDNAIMLFGDAKKIVQDVIKELREA